MSTPIHAMLTGTFTSDGAARFIELPPGYDSIELINITDIGSAAANTNVMRAKGYSSLPAGSAYLNLKTNGAATLAIESMLAAGGAGFRFVSDSADQTPGASVAVTGVSTANPAVVTSASTAVIGDIVRLNTLTGVAGNMYQICGMDFTVTATNPGVTQTLGYLNSAAFADAATGGFIRVIPYDARYYPRRRFITAITQAASAVITLSVTHGFTVGQKVRMVVPAAFGMTQMNGLLGTITAINTGTNTITVDINSTAFTAFAFPTSATAALGVNFPQVVPVGEAATSPYENLIDDATDNRSATGVIVGTGVQTTGVLYQWIARRGQSI